MKKKSGRVAVQLGRAAQDAKQLKQQQLQSKKKSKKYSSQQTALLARPWSATAQFEELSKEERDIVLDRIQKEIADAIAARAPSDGTAGAPVARPALASFVVRGVNHVARLIAKGELRVVVFATNPESLAFAHIPLLCRLHRVPICVLHLSSKTFGKLFALNSLVVLGIKKLPRAGSELAADASPDEASTVAPTEEAASALPQTQATLSALERSQLESITEFLIAKASKKNNLL